ncbi:MAG: aminoacyl-tRNA hydrolase [Patescibacteria group bacterium]|nr:aminoacyl-tRNA hydrolase [Patescibacteria group bacterium]
MILIVGLGNPGLKFKNTRHNLGFDIVNIIKKQGVFSAWQDKKKLKAKISQGEINNQKIILAKPETFMNLSGESVSRLIKFYKIPLKNLWVIHDDLDMELGKIKIKINSRSAGHKGVQSIIDQLIKKNFNHLKIGIGPRPIKIDAKKFVLKKFSKEEKKILCEKKKSAATMLLEQLNGKNT